MIRATVTLLLLSAVGLAGCSYLSLDESGRAGNPSGKPYAGEPGSIYDASAGPNRVSPPEKMYNLAPLAPMAPQTPVSSGPLQPASPTPGVR
jgi:hypothetical protein